MKYFKTSLSLFVLFFFLKEELLPFTKYLQDIWLYIGVSCHTFVVVVVCQTMYCIRRHSSWRAWGTPGIEDSVVSKFRKPYSNNSSTVRTLNILLMWITKRRIWNVSQLIDHRPFFKITGCRMKQIPFQLSLSEWGNWGLVRLCSQPKTLHYLILQLPSIYLMLVAVLGTGKTMTIH